MNRLNIMTESKAQRMVASLYSELEHRIMASPPGTCPVDMARAFIKLCHAQTCGKCAPCSIGLGQLAHMLDKVLDGTATMKTLDMIERTAKATYYSADCAIGYEAAKMILRCLDGYRDDFVEHIQNNKCLTDTRPSVPCVSYCPANVDVPGYIALIKEERYADAIRLIRKDNPFASACAYVCEHPCELRCRRHIIDDSINIRGLKRYAVDNAGQVDPPASAAGTGKKIAVVGGGPSGLSAAYYLRLMGHDVTVFEEKKKLGGMLRYGIPNYRLPRTILDSEIETILSTGIKVHLNTPIGKGDYSLESLRREYDAVYLSIGAQSDHKLGIDGEDANGVMSAVELLRKVGDDEIPDFTGKRIAVVGGGNVAMDVARTCVRCNADSVNIIYRRRKEDMTAQSEEIEGAIAEGCVVLELISPPRIQVDEDNNVKAICLQPQMIGTIKGGRPSPVPVEGENCYPCDIVMVAAGQLIDAADFEKSGVPLNRGKINANEDTSIANLAGVFSGGDCVSGPATVIKAVAAGKVAAANIDDYLGFHHEISKEDIDIPTVEYRETVPTGRVTLGERRPDSRVADFDLIEEPMSRAECEQECSRCLRCDFFGYGTFREGRIEKW